MMIALRSSSHHASKRSRLRPDCSIDGVAMTTHGPDASNWPAPLTTRTCLNEKGLPSCGYGGGWWQMVVVVGEWGPGVEGLRAFGVSRCAFLCSPRLPPPPKPFCPAPLSAPRLRPPLSPFPVSSKGARTCWNAARTSSFIVSMYV